ncbi:MAG: hypothetical protein KJN97_12725 [Deltaproteobacteria bacterium]|nr:hypothetical protein [Deltaproteobacteria bacterium]
MIHRTAHLLGSLLSTLLLLTPSSGCEKDADEAGRVMRPIVSPDFPEPIARVPLPAKWQLDTEHAPGEPSVVGPNGIRGYDTPFKGFSFPLDALQRQVYRQTKQKKRRFRSMEKVIEQDFVPEATKRGTHLVRTYEIPELAKYDERYHSQLYEALPSRKRFLAVGTEWEDEQGEPSFILIRLKVSEGQGSQFWSYYSHRLEAPRSVYEKAKEDLLYAVLNTEHNLAFIAANNQKEKAKSEAFWRKHRRRMNANQRNFEAQQRAFKERSDATNDAIMKGWRDRNAASDRMHDKTIDSIRDEQNMRDPSTGQSYKVESGADQYWKNDQGEYIKSDDRFYNPNRDPNVNNQDWNEMEEQR